MSRVQFVPIEIPHEESKSFTQLSASPTFIRVILLVATPPALSEVQTYVFDSMFKHQLTRESTFDLIRSYGNEVHKVEKSTEDT